MGPSDRRVPLSVSIVDAQGRPVRAPGLAVWLARVAPVTTPTAVTVAVVSDARVRALNRSYRGKDRETDVLSFPSQDQASVRATRSSRTCLGSPAPTFLGDIVIARGVAKRQALRLGHAERTEWRVLALHGLLHLLGYDHETDRGTMARAEARLRRKGGLSRGLIERGGPR
jgi:probable rRNA maturation factor